MTDKGDVNKKPLEKPAPTRRDVLLDRIRRSVIREPNIKINVDDILPKEIFDFTEDELENVVRNIDLQKVSDSALLNAKGVISAVSKITEFATAQQITFRKAEKDDDLAKDVDELMLEVFGQVPVISRIIMKLLTHMEYLPPNNES